ncbi:uncharacterized protein LOC104906312 [Beta vulgaris subsp. vulgaris]|uniref:uncharacterized protein LOC104906312 n=1 Tax=Beta vulgaris subsp. vulgaris TaxID=3555 RepID=UPI0025487A9E|nr:uncharacterized protein LOC104906312 [Beta vulgaris subsp. vulgaris]
MFIDFRKKETNREGNIEDEFVGKNVPTILEKEAEEEYNPHKRCQVSKSTPSKPAGKKETIVRCRPATLIDLFKKLSTGQKEVVCSIGFGSLFKLKLEEFPRDMIRVLCRNFCPKDKVLMIGNHRVQLKPADVAGVF